MNHLHYQPIVLMLIGCLLQAIPTTAQPLFEYPFDWNALALAARNNALASMNATNQGAVLRVNPYISPVWKNDAFTGNFYREMSPSGTTLNVLIESTKGGFDTGLQVRPNGSSPAHARVDALSDGLTLSATINVDLDGEGRWWVGPKLSTRPCTSSGDCPGTWVSGWYENYIVENSSATPQETHDRLVSLGVYLGESYQDGSTYRHYFKQQSNWGQFWAVRQSYRSAGEVHIKSIFDFWRQHGQPNDYLFALRCNLETSGTWAGRVEITGFDVPTDRWTGGGAPNPESALTIRARGSCGNEQMELRVDDQPVRTWTVTDSFTEYRYSDYSGGAVSLHFTNDQPGSESCADPNLQIDYLEIDDKIFQAEAQAINTGAWNLAESSCGGVSSEWLHCNGYIAFALNNTEQSDQKGELARGGGSPNAGLQLYPNPSQGQAWVQLPTQVSSDRVDWQIVDASGRPVRWGSSPTHRWSLSTQGLVPGTYLVKVKQPGQQWTQRLLIE